MEKEKLDEIYNNVKTFAETASSYIDQKITDQWIKNIRAFNNKHYSNKIYNDPRLRGRSKLFIPKTRASILRIVASIVSEFFSSPDNVSIKSTKRFNSKLDAAAKLLEEAVNYRLNTNIKWFLVAYMAIIDVMVLGRGVLNVGWNYEEEIVESKTEVINPVTGEIEIVDVSEVVARVDEPFIRYVKLWNILVDSNCNPLDPINDSPVLIEKKPVYVFDVIKKINSGEWNKPKGFSDVEDKTEFFSKYLWKKNIIEDELDEDSVDEEKKCRSEWSHVEIWDVYVRVDGDDYFYTSLAGEHALTDLELVEDKFPCKGRPYVMGGFQPESNEVYWMGFPEVIEPLQRELNSIRNQRRDNVNIALNKRFLIRSTAGINISSLNSGTPGSPIIADDISEQSIREIDVKDVTQSSYREEEINRRDFEEVGGVNAYNLGSPRPGMNPTATGVSIMTEQSNLPIGMTTKTIAETLFKPVIEMLVQFEQMFESNEVLKRACTDIDISFEEAWDQDAIENQYSVEVSIGVGATSREMRFRNLGMLVDRSFAINSQMGAPIINFVEMFREMASLAGEKNVDKYINKNVYNAIMSKMGEAIGRNLTNPMEPPINVMGTGGNGQTNQPGMETQTESTQGFGGEQQIYR